MSADPRCYSLELKNTKEKLKLTNLGIHVVITGFLAKTAVTMTFMNDTDHDGVEGELVFPMAEGSVLSGYAIDINGELVEGVVIEKEKARQVFETEARKEVSHKPTASIAEHVVGNVFKTRVFPIPKRGPRTIRVTTVEEVDGKNTFYLLLDFASRLVDQYEISVQVDSYGSVAPKIWDGLSSTARSGRTMPALEFSAKTSKNTASTLNSSLSDPVADRTRYQERFSSSSPSSPKGCIVYLPPSENIVIVEPNETKTEHYFVVGGQFSSFSSVLPPAGSEFDVTNNRVGIVWDTSLSRMSHDKKVDMEVVKLIASKLGKGAKIDIIPFSDAMRTPFTFTMTGNASSDHSTLTNHLNALTYDGGTNISSLNLTKGPTAEESSSITTDTYAYYCLFTDGMHNMSTKAMPKALESPVYIFASSSEANTSLLKILARKSGGEYFKLSLSSSNHELKQKVDSLGKPVFSFLGVNVDSNFVREVYPSIPTRVDSVFRLSGKLVLDSDSESSDGSKKTSINSKFAGTFITLNFGFGVKVVHSITCQLKTDGASYTSLIPRFWAQRKIDELTLFPEETENEKIILDLGRKFSIVTPTTSIIVLEELEQYVKHEIEPPVALQSIRAKWLAIMQERANEKKAIEEEKILSVLSLWNRRTAWWNEDVASSEAQEKNHMHCMPYGDGVDMVERTLASQWIDWDKLHEDSSDSESSGSDSYSSDEDSSQMSSDFSSDSSSGSEAEENGSSSSSYAVTDDDDEVSLFAELGERMRMDPKKPAKNVFKSDSGQDKGGKYDKGKVIPSNRGLEMAKLNEEARMDFVIHSLVTQTESVKKEAVEEARKNSLKKKKKMEVAKQEVEEVVEVDRLKSTLASSLKSFSSQRLSSRFDESVVEQAAKPVAPWKRMKQREADIHSKADLMDEEMDEDMDAPKERKKSISSPRGRSSKMKDKEKVELPPPLPKPIAPVSMPPPSASTAPPAAPSARLPLGGKPPSLSDERLRSTRTSSLASNAGYPQSSVGPAPVQYGAQPMQQMQFGAPPMQQMRYGFGTPAPLSAAPTADFSFASSMPPLAPSGSSSALPPPPPHAVSVSFSALPPPPPPAAGPAPPPPAGPPPPSAPAPSASGPAPRAPSTLSAAPPRPSTGSAPAPSATPTTSSSISSSSSSISLLVSNRLNAFHSTKSKKLAPSQPAAQAAPAPSIQEVLMRRSVVDDEDSSDGDDDDWDGDANRAEKLEEAEIQESSQPDLFGDYGEAEAAPMESSMSGFSLADESPLEELSIQSYLLSSVSKSSDISDSPISASRRMSPPPVEPSAPAKEKEKVSTKSRRVSRADVSISRSSQQQQLQQQQPLTTTDSAKLVLNKPPTGFASLASQPSVTSNTATFGRQDQKPAISGFGLKAPSAAKVTTFGGVPAGPTAAGGFGRGSDTAAGGFGRGSDTAAGRGGAATGGFGRGGATAAGRGGAATGGFGRGSATAAGGFATGATFGRRTGSTEQKPTPKPESTTQFSFNFDSGPSVTDDANEVGSGEANYNLPSEPAPTPYQLAQRAQEAQMKREIEELERATQARRSSHAAQRYQQAFQPSVAQTAWDSLGSSNLIPYISPKVSLEYAYYQEVDPNAPVEYSKDLTPAPEFPPVDWSTINYGQTPASQSWKRWRERHPEQSWSEYEGKAFSKGDTFMDLFNRNRRIFLQARIQADFEAIETDNRKNRRLRPTEKPHVKYRTVLSKETVPSDESWQLELELHTSSKSAYDQYLKMRVRPELAKLTKFYMDAADYFFEKLKDTHKAATILSNLAELELENPQFLRLIAFRLERAPEDPYLQVAINLYRKVLAIRSEEPQSHRDLAMALTRRALFLVRSLEEKKNSPSSESMPGASIGKSAKKAMMLMSRPAFDRYALIEERKVQAEIRSLLEESVKLLNAVVIKKWDVRFNQVEVVALMDLNRVVAIIKSLNLEHTMGLAHLVDPRVISLQMPVDIRVQIQWDTDMTDVELTVVEPSGEKCNSIHNKTNSGGMMSRDFTHGYGPVEYLTRYAGDGHYSASIKLFHALEMKSGTTVLVRIWTDYGKPAAEREHFFIGRLNKAKQSLQVVDISVRNGVAITKA